RRQEPQPDHSQQTLLRLGIFKRQEILASGLQGDGLLRLRRSKEIFPNRWLTPLINHYAPIDREASTPCIDQSKSVVPRLPGRKAAGGTKRELLGIDSPRHLPEPHKLRSGFRLLQDGSARQVAVIEILNG